MCLLWSLKIGYIASALGKSCTLDPGTSNFPSLVQSAHDCPSPPSRIGRTDYGAVGMPRWAKRVLTVMCEDVFLASVALFSQLFIFTFSIVLSSTCGWKLTSHIVSGHSHIPCTVLCTFILQSIYVTFLSVLSSCHTTIIYFYVLLFLLAQKTQCDSRLISRPQSTTPDKDNLHCQRRGGSFFAKATE